MSNQFLTNYTETTFLEKIKDNLRHCKSFEFSVSSIKKAGLVLLPLVPDNINSYMCSRFAGQMRDMELQNGVDEYTEMAKSIVDLYLIVQIGYYTKEKVGI